MNSARTGVPAVIFWIRSLQGFAQVFLLQGLRAERPHGTPRLAQALAGQFAGAREVFPGFGRQPLGHRLLGGFQLHDHAGESLRQRVVDVARHAIALGHHGRLPALARIGALSWIASIA